MKGCEWKMKGFVGIIGGLGSKAAAEFISSIVDGTDAKTDQEHVNFHLLNHASIPDRSAYILDQSNPNPLPYLLKDVRELTRAKVSFIVIPCNTAHYFYDKLQAITPVPIINMIHETAAYITDHYSDAKKIGILATEGTVAGKMYQRELTKVGLIPVVPPQNIQRTVNKLIFEQVKQGKAVDYHLYLDVLEHMYRMGCDTVILGCTELSVIENGASHHGFRVVDSQSVLVERTIVLAGKKMKQHHAILQ